MSTETRCPSAYHVLRAIAWRELRVAAQRRLVRWLFIGSLLPVLVFATILVVRVIAEEKFDQDLDWDPILYFLSVEGGFVALLTLGIGTPLVARDRAEDVLFLYATRPVLPWHYMAGKMAAVLVPAAGLLLFPGIMLAALRLGLLRDVGSLDTLVLFGKVSVAGILVGLGYAGISVGASALTTRARWSLLLALGIYMLPDAVAGVIFGSDAPALGPGRATADLLGTLFDSVELWRGIVAGIVLLAYGVAGGVVTVLRVKREMIP